MKKSVVGLTVRLPERGVVIRDGGGRAGGSIL